MVSPPSASFKYIFSLFRFIEYPFLGYSFIQDGIYCVPCALVGSTRNVKITSYGTIYRLISLFIKTPVIPSNTFRGKIRLHIDLELHKENVKKVTELYGDDWMRTETSESIHR